MKEKDFIKVYKEERNLKNLKEAQHRISTFWETVEEILQEDIPHYTLVYPMLNVAIRKNVKNMIFRNDGYIDVENMYVINEK